MGLVLLCEHSAQVLGPALGERSCATVVLFIVLE